MTSLSSEKKKAKRRHGPPANGEFSLVLETSTDLDVSVAVAIEVSNVTTTETQLDLSIVPRPDGKSFKHNEFETFYHYYSEKIDTDAIEKEDLRKYWNQLFVSKNNGKKPDALFVKSPNSPPSDDAEKVKNIDQKN